jgi:betaine-aldehyde dehydrogenase
VIDLMEKVRTYQQFIGGEFVAAASGGTLDVENRATGQVIARVPKSGAEDLDRAANAAAKAFESLSQTTPQERSLALLKLADSVESRADELGRLESSHTVKPSGIAIDEMAVVADLF